ncbi:MAG: NAD(P)-dependent oxidoreductase [Oscillospiraceae bacterium]|nr:NAD(P)-dependent oxidoreductase [Oscillospiraceae bacterium]
MKMVVYAVNDEERIFFEAYKDQYAAELLLTEEKPSLENAGLAAGMDAVNVLSDVVITDAMYDRYKALGVQVVVTRTIGAEHMNLSYARKIGMKVCNITYSPASVADYAIMMMLMVLRHVKPMLQRYAGRDFTAQGIRGRELPNMTVGVIGTGRIGQTLIRHLSGFGCKVLAWSRTERKELEGLCDYVPLEQLLAESDIVSLHLSSTPETFHFMNAQRIGSMKPGAVLINTGRGALVDSWALIEGLESGHLGGAGLDMIDGDRSIYYRDFKNTLVPSREMAILSAMPNVLMLPHMAYYTDQASDDMVRLGLENALLLLEGKDCPFRLC